MGKQRNEGPKLRGTTDTASLSPSLPRGEAQPQLCHWSPPNPQVLPEDLPQPQPQKHNFSSTVEYSLPTQRYGTNESVQGHGTCLDNSPTQLCPKPDEKRVHSCSLGWAALPTHSHPSWGDTCTYHLRTPAHPPMQASVSVTCFAK